MATPAFVLGVAIAVVVLSFHLTIHLQMVSQEACAFVAILHYLGRGIFDHFHRHNDDGMFFLWMWDISEPIPVYYHHTPGRLGYTTYPDHTWTTNYKADNLGGRTCLHPPFGDVGGNTVAYSHLFFDHVSFIY
tara:strand:+ start:272 stop:670 length:399 start_codon:yes stop_codon:yes gene_type:complete